MKRKKKESYDGEFDLYDSSFVYVETREIKRTVVEEFVNIDESLKELERNSDLIRMEMNIIEFPIFSKNRTLKENQIRKYYFSIDKTKYIEIIPPENETIPGELEEKVFIGLLKIFKEFGYQQTFYCTASDILDSINVLERKTRNSLFPKVKNAIEKLAVTHYKFNNVFYSNQEKGVLNDLISTNILTYRLITFKESNPLEREYFKDGRVKEIYKINISPEVYDNLIKKGYLVFDSDELLNIKDSVTRSIYTQITKWRNNELYLRRPAFFIARRIPLSWNNNPSIRNSVKKISKCLEELKSLSYIADFKEIKGRKAELTEFEIIFDKEHNKYKQELFYQEKIDYNNIVHFVEDRQNVLTPTADASNDISKIIETFGTKGQSLKTLPNVIEEALKKYDYDYVLYSAEYTMINAKLSILKYFKDTLTNNWADEYIAKKKSKIDKVKEKDIEEAVIVDEQMEDSKPIFSWEDFEKLSKESQDELTTIAYTNYLSDTSTVDNKTNRGIFDKVKKSLILKLSDKYLELKKRDDSSLENVVEPVKEVEKRNAKTMYDEIIKSYGSIAKFTMELYLIVKERNSKVSLEDVGGSLKLFEEYEDDYVHATFDSSEKTGSYKIK